MRRLSPLALLLALLLLPAGVGLAALERRTAREALDRSLGQEAAQQREALDAYFERARAVSLLTGHNPAFREFYEAPGSRRAKVADGGRGITNASASLLYLERLYPGSIGEACFIDRSGAENARAVNGRLAEIGDLSQDESAGPFFAPAFRQRPGQVYHARPYRSPDTGEWVIANTTPIPGARRPRAIVHFEVRIESFRRAAAHTGRNALKVVDASTGAVVIDSQTHQRRGGRLGVPGDRRFVALRGSVRKSGATTVAGRRAAYERIRGGEGNANQWLVVAVARSASPSLARLRRRRADGHDARGPPAARVHPGQRPRRQSARRGADRRADRTGQPPAVPAPARAGDSSGRPPGAVGRAADDGPRPLQGAQRHARPSRRRPPARATRPAAARRHPGGRHPCGLGGDEFAILVTDVADRDAGGRVAQRIRAALDAPFTLEGLAVHIQASIGIALFPDQGEDATNLLQRADVAMYQAKQQRTGWELYDAGRDLHSRDRLALLGELRGALRDGQLLLHYQPKADLRSGQVTGVEALVRWKHPDRGLLFPDAFVAMAEQAGLMRQLTAYVLDAALAQAAAWRDDGRPLAVAVNVSATDLMDSGFPGEVEALLARHGVRSEDLQLEVTEDTIMSDPERALDSLARLSETGVSISLDDYGTGYSSLAYVKRLPIRELKIEGYLLTKPLPAAELDDWLKHWESHGAAFGRAPEWTGSDPVKAPFAGTGVGLSVI